MKKKFGIPLGVIGFIFSFGLSLALASIALSAESGDVIIEKISANAAEELLQGRRDIENTENTENRAVAFPNLIMVAHQFTFGPKSIKPISLVKMQSSFLNERFVRKILDADQVTCQSSKRLICAVHLKVGVGWGMFALQKKLDFILEAQIKSSVDFPDSLFLQIVQRDFHHVLFEKIDTFLWIKKAEDRNQITVSLLQVIAPAPAWIERIDRYDPVVQWMLQKKVEDLRREVVKLLN